MNLKSHFNNDEGKLFFILLRKKDGKRRELGGVEKDCVVSPGTLLQTLELNSEENTFYSQSVCLRTLGNPELYLCCGSGDIESLDISIFHLLLPIQSLKDRIFVFKDKHLLSDGKLLQNGDRVFVRLKDLQSEIEGFIRYKGSIDETAGTYFGVEFMENRGVSDGLHNNFRYFHTAPNHAAFVPLHRIRRNREDWQKNDLFWAGDVQAVNNSHVPLEVKKSISLGAEAKQMNSYGDLMIGDRIIWPSDNGYERGTVRWIGVLPDEMKNNVTIGVEFDNQVGTGTGKYKDRRLFTAKQGYASLIPPLGLIKETECLKYQVTRKPMYSEEEQCAVQIPKADTKRSSLPVQFNHHTGFLEPLPAVNGASQSMSEQGKGRKTLTNGLYPDLPLTVGCMVEVPSSTIPVHGVIRWIGFSDSNPTKQMAGLELENDLPIGTDGVFKNRKYFDCQPGKALFIPLNKCVRDRRFTFSEMVGGGISSPNVAGDIPVPEVVNYNQLRIISGKNRGIQGHHNSCYLDSTLFCMFYFSTVFDSIFNRPPKPDDLPQYTEVQKVLKEGIVNPLRKHNYVASNNVWKLRTLLDKLGTVPGMLGEEKDVEEFLSALLSQIMKADPLLHLSTGEHAYFYQLFMEKDENLLLPSTQKLVELSFLQGNVKLKQVPACLMIQMPRFGKDYKMFRRIVPSLQLDITDILENYPRDCIVCGDLATWECKKCYQVHGLGLNTTAFCDKCRLKSHQHTQRKNHEPERIVTDAYLSYFQEQRAVNQEHSDILSLPREKMELFAVICIQTSHYVSFVKCGPGIDAPWVFFDSMADRIGEQGGYNVPEVTHVPEMASWLSENNLINLNKDEDKELPEHLRRLLCDGYMCMYQSPDVMMFQ